MKFEGTRVKKETRSSTLGGTPGLTFDFAYLYHLLLRKSWMIIVFVVLSLSAATIYLIVSPKIYASRAVIQVEQEAPKVINIASINPEEFRSVEELKTIEQDLISDTLILRVIKANGLEKDSLFAPPKKDGSAYMDSELVQRFHAKLSVRLRRETRLIDIIVEDRNPKQAQRLAQSVVTEFLNESFDQKLNITKVANNFLLQEAQRLKDKLHKSEEAVQQYRESYHAVSLEEKQNITVEKLKELNLKVTEAKSERLKLEADVAAIQDGRVKNPEDLLLLPSVTALPEVADLVKQLANKQAVFKTESQIKGLRETLNRALVKAGAMVVKSYTTAKNAETKLQAALNEQEQAALELNRIAIQYNVLVREVESDRALYESVLTRMKETAVTKNLGEDNVRIVESPLLAVEPTKPRKLKILALALLAGLLVGTSTVVGIEMVDNSIHSVDQAERFLGYPVLASVPESKRKTVGRESVLTSDPACHEAEAFRSLRTALCLLGREKENKTVLFTSATPAEGKTYCSLNYAVALAQLGLRTLLVDADLRRPTLSKIMMAEAKGLTACLARRATIVDCCEPTSIENLFILGVGDRAGRPAELLASGDFANLLNEAALDFDRIVLDSAPINAVSDTQLIAKNIQTVCLVIRTGKTPQRAIMRACYLLALAAHTPDGIVLNRMARGSRDSYYFSYYAAEYAKAGAKNLCAGPRRLLYPE
jgi:succinoglycan biosynthesis transport protein ExoP